MDRFRILPSYHYEDNNDGNLLKSVGKPLRDYRIEGECVQDGTPTPEAPIEIECCGDKTANMIQYPYADTSKTVNGITFTDNGDGTITINGTASANAQFNIANHRDSNWGIENGKTYTLSIRYTGNVTGTCNAVVNLYNDWETTYKAYLSTTLPKISATKLCEYDVIGIRAYLHIASGSSFNNCTVRVQLEEGDVATEYEPYGYKIPITVEGKSLIDMSAVLEQNMYINSTNGTTFKPSAGEWRYSDYTKIEEGKTYLFVANNSDATAAGIAWYDSSKAYVSGVNTKTINAANGVIIAPSGAYYVRLSWKINGGYNPDWQNTVKLLDSEPQTYNIYLDEPLRKVGDYADYIGYRKKKVIRKTYLTDDSGTKTIDESIGVLETPTETEIDLPEVLTKKGTNVISIGTTTKPSTTIYQYYKGGS
jgi:hypothetical protein